VPGTCGVAPPGVAGAEEDDEEDALDDEEAAGSSWRQRASPTCGWAGSTIVPHAIICPGIEAHDGACGVCAPKPHTGSGW
jgi:hypothetical protein